MADTRDVNITEGIIAPLVNEIAADTGRAYNMAEIVSALEDIAADENVTVSSMPADFVESVIRTYEIRR